MFDTKNVSMLETGFAKAPIGMAFLTPDLHWVRINHEFCDLLGYSREELWGVKCDDILDPAEIDRVKIFRNRMASGEMQTAKIETRYIRKDKSPINVEIRSSLMTDSDGRPEYFIDIVEDITELKQARSVAYETAENYQLLVENAADHAIMRMDNDGIIASWNTGAAAIFGYNEEEIIGQPSSVFFIPEDVETGQDKLEMELAVKNGRSDDDRWHVRKDGSRFWSSGVVTPVQDEKGNRNGFVKILRDLTDRKLSQERSVYLSQHDTLTTLPNRGKFNEELDRVIAEARIGKFKVGVLFIDLDRFKNINDSLGHHIGDALLREVARRLKESVRKTDMVARLGGDEFGVICSGVSDRSEMAHLAAKLVEELSKPFLLHAHHITIGASIGVSISPNDADDVNQILKYADMAMYHAKSNGRSTFEFYTDDLDIEAKRRSTIEEQLRHAIERGELYLNYQPQISLEENRTCCVEALLRWENSRLGPFTTEEFIALADETGLIVPIGRWVMQNACKQLKVWQAQHPDLRIAVNVSSKQIEEPSFLEMVDQTLQESGIDPHTLELEITERLLMEDNLRNNSVLRLLKERGIKISVDDFGTGFSSLSYLKHFPVDSLKIDKLFIKCLPDDQHDAAIASAIIGMAHSLELQVIAEGVETEGQRDFLRNLGCNCGQGFLFSEPVPPEKLMQMLHGKIGRTELQGVKHATA